jgi:hypothetical protein
MKLTVVDVINTLMPQSAFGFLLIDADYDSTSSRASIKQRVDTTSN